MGSTTRNKQSGKEHLADKVTLRDVASFDSPGSRNNGHSEAEFRSMFENAPIGIYESTMGGRFLKVNPRLIEMLGYDSEEEMLSLDLDSDVYYEPGARARVIGQFLGVAIATELQVRWKKKSGEPLWVSLSIHTVTNDDGSVRHFEGFVTDATLRKAAEETLVQKEEYFRSIIENSVDALMLIDETGRIRYAAQKDAIGYKPSEIIGEPFFARVHPEDQSFVKEQFQDLLSRPDGRLLIKARARRENGEWRHLEIVARNLLHNPSVESIVANFRDVTDRIVAEQLLVESELKYRQLVEQASDGIMIVSPEGTLNYVNEKFCQMTGYDPSALIGRSVLDTYPPGYEEMASTNLRQTNSKQSENLERPLRRSDGTWFPVEISARRLPNGTYHGIVRDVTERKKAEDALRESEQRFRQLLEYNGLIAIILNADGTLAYGNRKFRSLTGLGQEELVGLNWFDHFLPKNKREGRKALFRRAMERGFIQNSFSHEILVNDERRIFQWNSTVIRDLQGRTVGTATIGEDITERKQAENALRESEEKFRSLAEESPNMIFINKDGRVLYANKRCEEIMGYTIDELVSPSFDFRCLIDSESRSIVEKNFEKHEQGENISPYEYALIRKNGEKVFGLHATRLINYEGGPAILGIITDVTEQRKAADTQRRLLNAVEQSRDVIFMTDVDGQITYVNPSFESVYGIRREDAIGMTPRILKSGMYPKEYYSSFWDTLLLGQSRVDIITNKTRDGRLINVESSISPILGSDGNVVGFLAVQTDITEKKEAEDKVRQQAALLDIATDAITVIDREANIQFWNKSAERLYGWPAVEVLGRSLASAVGLDAKECGRALQSTLENGSWKGEFTTFSRNRRSVVVQSRWTLLRDEAQTPKSILVVNSDITEQKVLQRQFYQSQRLESLGTLAGGIAHDLNNVLAPILLSMDVLGRFVKEEQGQKLLKTALDSANRGKRIVNQVLTFARGADSKKGPIQIRHLIAEAANIVKETFPKSIDIECNFEPHLWTVNADPTQVHQVIMNLLVNARDAMPRGGQLSIAANNMMLDEIFCRTQLRAHPGPYVVLTVTDTGSGIPAEILEKIFDPFFTTKDVGKGTGLGLTTVHTIVNSHDGFVNVASTVGKGTTFSVFLPATTQESAREPVQSPVERNPASHGERILVIDDEAAIRDITEHVLTSRGFHVTTAADGIEAVAFFAEHSGTIDLVLADLMMPIMDGVATVRALRRIKPDIPVIAMSGMVADEKLLKNPDFAPRAFLAKPFTAELLLEAITKALSAGT